MSTLIQWDCVCVCVISILDFDSKGVSKKILFFVQMKVQFLLSWCVETGVNELSPLFRNVHQKHGKYNIYLTIIQESNLIVILCASVSQWHVCYIYILLLCNYEIVYVMNHLQGL